MNDCDILDGELDGVDDEVLYISAQKPDPMQAVEHARPSSKPVDHVDLSCIREKQPPDRLDYQAAPKRKAEPSHVVN